MNYAATIHSFGFALTVQAAAAPITISGRVRSKRSPASVPARWGLPPIP